MMSDWLSFPIKSQEASKLGDNWLPPPLANVDLVVLECTEFMTLLWYLFYLFFMYLPDILLSVDFLISI